MQAAETARSANRPTSDLTAYDLYLRAFAMRAQLPEALALLEEAIARDPNYGPALALAAVWCMNLVSDGSTPDRDAARQRGLASARRALQVAGNDPAVLADAAYALACFGEDIDAMIAVVDRALAFNPSYARGWHISGFLRLWAGDTEGAIQHAGMALRLSPRAEAGRELLADRCRAVLRPAFRRGGSEAPPRDRGNAGFPDPLPFPRGLLRPHGTARRGARHDRSTARDNAGNHPRIPAALPQSRASRIVFLGPAAGDGRCHVTTTRHLAAILAADV